MPFQYEWDEKNNVLINFYSGEITIEEVKQTYRDAEHYYDNSIGTVHNIIHLTKSDFYKTIRQDKMFSLPEAMHYAEKYRDRIGWSLYVGHKNNALYRMISSINMQRQKLRLKWFDEMDEAYQFLYEEGLIESAQSPFPGR